MLTRQKCEGCPGSISEEAQKPNRRIRLGQNEVLEIFDNDNGKGHHTHLLGADRSVIEGWQDDHGALPTCKPWKDGLCLTQFPDKHIILHYPLKP